MNDSIQLIVGLGNPGTEYANTRHNAGADFVEQLAQQHNISLKPEKKYQGRYGKIELNGTVIHLLIPTTFMNLSGQSVSSLTNFFKIPSQNILVAHDELDLPSGCARFKQKGGHGGHNGLRDIISKLGNNQNFYRLRLGIGHPGQAHLVSNYVLRKAPLSEQQKLAAASDEVLRYLPLACQGNWQDAMNQLHSFTG